MGKLSGKYALIIEDDMPSVEVLQMLLDQVSVDSEVIGDNQRIANDLDEVNVPDVIFLDLEMPSSNGYKVLDMIRSSQRFDDVPVVAYTTHTSHLNDARKAGFHSFLGKPLDSARFAEQLERILNGESVWDIP